MHTVLFAALALGSLRCWRCSWGWVSEVVGEGPFLPVVLLAIERLINYRELVRVPC